MIERIKHIAENVREWAEEKQKNASEYDACYDWSSDLCGMCAICSYELARRLNRAGFHPKIIVNEIHTFVKVKSYIVDITATQFESDYPKVVIKKEKDTNKLPYYWEEENSFSFGNYKKLKRIFSNWPESQHPLFFRRQGICA